MRLRRREFDVQWTDRGIAVVSTDKPLTPKRKQRMHALLEKLSSDASASASDERPGTSLTPPEVEVPGLPNVSDTTIAQACERIDLLEQEVEALQRENARLKSWLGTR